jgi:hypothetical protein
MKNFGFLVFIGVIAALLNIAGNRMGFDFIACTALVFALDRETA